MDVDLSGIRGVPLRRGAIAQRVAPQPAAAVRGWLDRLLEAVIHGAPEARTTLVAWASLLACDADAGLKLRSLEVARGSSEAISALTRAFIMATAAPSCARRMPLRAKDLTRRVGRAQVHFAFSSTVMELAPVERETPKEADRAGLPVLHPPGLDGLSENGVDVRLPFEEDRPGEAWGQNREPERLKLRWVLRRQRFGWEFWRRRETLFAGDVSTRRSVLKGPTLTEVEVLGMASRRPTRAGLLLAIAQSDRWFIRPRVREALANNPYTPSWLVAALLPTSSPATVRDRARHHDAPLVQALAQTLLDPDEDEAR